MDVEGIEPGVDFHEVLTNRVARCAALLAVIGPDWLGARTAGGELRLHQDNDYVRIEIATALARDIRVIPVLVEGAVMPCEADLPDALKPLARRNAVELTHARFTSDMKHLTDALKKIVVDVKDPIDPNLPVMRGLTESYGTSLPAKVFYFAPEIPEKLLRVASARCGLPETERVYLLVDLTLLRNANNAMLFTSKGLRIYNDQSMRGKGISPLFLPYQLIRDADIRKAKWPGVAVGDFTLNGGGGPDQDVLLDVLLTLKQGLNRLEKEGGDVRTLFSS